MFFRKYILVLILSVFSVLLFAQNSYELLTVTDGHELYSDFNKTDESGFSCNLRTYPTSSFNYQNNQVYEFANDNSTDTSNWNLNLTRQDTCLHVGGWVRDSFGNYFVIGSGVHYFDFDSIINMFEWIMKLNNNREFLWEKLYNRPQYTDDLNRGGLNEILDMGQNRILVSGTLEKKDDPAKRGIYLMQFNNQGDTLQTRVIDPILGKYVQAITYNYDSSAVLLHKIFGSFPGRCHNLYGYNDGALSLDTASFDTIGYKCYYEPEFDSKLSSIIDAKLSNTGNLYVAGRAYYSYNGGRHISIFKYDSSFNILAHTKLTPPDTIINPGWMQNIDINENGEVFVSGSYDNELGMFPSYYCYVYVAKLDSELNLLSERYFGGDASYDVFGMVATGDGGMALGGYRYDYLINGESEGDAFIIKTDAGLWVDVKENRQIPMHSAICYPNPGSNQLNIRTTLKNSLIEIYDFYGRLIITKKIKYLVTEINTQLLPVGNYIWIIRQNGVVVDKGKWIKL